jgi:hypothetical protein
LVFMVGLSPLKRIIKQECLWDVMPM